MGSGGTGALFSGALSGTAPLAIGAIGAAAITALYLVRLRRRRVVVAFAPLWLGLAGEPSATRFSSRLRHWLSLALALAIFGAIWVGAVDPRPAAVDLAGRSLVILIDRSASMSARDEPGTRLQAAKTRAIEIAAGLTPADRALVASFAADATAESGFETDPHRLARAIAAVTPSEEPGDLPRALAFAAAILHGRPGPTVVLISDGGFSDDARRAPPAGLDLRYAPVGRRAQNVGILSFAARRLPADPTTVDTALVVQSFCPAPARVGVEIGVGGTIVEKLSLSLAPGERRQLALENLFAPEARIEARLTGTDGLPAGVAGVEGVEGVDDLALDDRAVAVVPPLPRRHVLRVGGPDLYLDGALLSLGRTVHVDRLGAAEVDRAPARSHDYDLVIFDGVTPATSPTAGRYLYLNPDGGGSPFPVRGTVRDPVLDPASLHREHPLLRELDLTDVNVAEAHRLALAPGDLALAGSFGVPLVVARERPGLRIAALSFDPRRSDLPMRPAFPLLIANALAWTARDSVDSIDEGRAAAPTDDETVRDARESDTTPAPTLVLGGRAMAPPDPAARHRGARLPVLALALAAALLLFEWVSYHRRWTT
ncbi:MAG TPA: VWA domain-containing protein [Polyangia bacterium]|nr:VWA domain-containing protein [Polyangia bacterium]